MGSITISYEAEGGSEFRLATTLNATFVPRIGDIVDLEDARLRKVINVVVYPRTSLVLVILRDLQEA
jgi:hypothetical protein